MRNNRATVPLQVNEFTGGLNTEFNPLASPPNIALEMENMELTKKGGVKKRVGFDLEEDREIITTGVSFRGGQKLSRNIFKWENAGGNADKSLLVTQVGQYLAIFDLDGGDVTSNNKIYDELFESDIYSNGLSFSSVDGLLVVVNGTDLITIYTYDNGVITQEKKKFLVRDLFGVQAIVGGIDLTAVPNTQTRPESINNDHIYNLRNQTFNKPYYPGNNETLKDPIQSFYEESNKEVDESTRSLPKAYPSYSDSILPYVYADPADDSNGGSSRTVERFFRRIMTSDSTGSDSSPRGHFIIDALNRGNSRLKRVQDIEGRNPELNFKVNSLKADRTPGGATCTESFAGRVWFSGFSGDIIDGDSHSPRMSSYVLFSRLVNSPTDINKCYQAADPTSKDDSALVDTDGGFIRLDGAYDISHMTVLDGSLFIFAANGVWRISGDDQSGFKATAYKAEKISRMGTISPNSVVTAEGKVFFWGEKSINVLTRSELGIWDVVDITEKTIQSLYDLISEDNKRSCFGHYDIYQKRLSWVYTNVVTSNFSEELILDLTYNAFTYNKIPTKNNNLPLILGVSETEPYRLSTLEEDVTADGVVVNADGIAVTATSNTRVEGIKSSIYLCMTHKFPSIRFSFGLYRKDDFYDWDDTPYDSYVITGSFTGGEARSFKQAPYLTMFFNRTEDGFNEDLSPTNASSCLVSSQWNWTIDPVANKWSTPREAYRLKGLYMPNGPEDEYVTGESVIKTRNKIRGYG